MAHLTRNNGAIRAKLELHLMRFAPDTYTPKFIKDIRDLYEYRFFIRQINFSEKSFLYLLDIVCQVVKNKGRFRTLDCLKVLKWILKDKPSDSLLSSDVVDKLFFLYQAYVFHNNNELQRAVRIYLKDVILTDTKIHWLIEHADDSPMILNRLLRYPEHNPLIVSWAADVYGQHKYSDRQSEIIALLIEGDIPKFVDLTNLSAVLWAIYYARIDDQTKRNLLEQTFSFETIDYLIEICTRKAYVDVLENVRKRLKEDH